MPLLINAACTNADISAYGTPSSKSNNLLSRGGHHFRVCIALALPCYEEDEMGCKLAEDKQEVRVAEDSRSWR
ncbi:hypothetical protein PILCRDRAFT_827616 [Piloderma croceum F 1598]|uniref:Uncharacterized protein n=1 Tax=Piloderma croceum (strain F 1598) TaxID=765440 RepID=A0A0C3F4S1_PILCF|nr:hypothetical protein PILCRDRAFT_827616 [Piloderma croceum F 1598]